MVEEFNINQIKSYNTLGIKSPPSYRPLGWNKLSKMDIELYKPYVYYAIGNGDCFLHSLYTQIGSLSNLNIKAPFLCNPDYTNKLPYHQTDYNDKKSLETLFGKGHKDYTYKSSLVQLLRKDISLWLDLPAYNQETKSYYTEEECYNRINHNVKNIELWFTGVFLNPHNLIYKTKIDEAIDFIDNLYDIYLNNEKGVIDKLKESILLSSDDDLTEFYGLPDEELIKRGRQKNIEYKIWNSYLENNFKLMKEAEGIMKNSNYVDTLFTSFYRYPLFGGLTFFQKLLEREYLQQLDNDNIPEWFVKRLESEYNTLISDTVKQLKLDGYDEKYINNIIENNKNWVDERIIDRKNNSLESIIVNKEVIANKDNLDLSTIYFNAYYNSEYIDNNYKLLINNNTHEFTINTIKEFIKQGKNEDYIINFISKDIYTEMDFIKNLKIYIKSYMNIVNYITSFIGISLNNHIYGKWSNKDGNLFKDKTYEDMLNLAQESIYIYTQKISTKEEIDNEFNKDFRKRIINGEPVISEFEIFKDPLTKIELYTSTYQQDTEVINLPININYFMLEDGFLLQSNVAERSYKFFKKHLPTYEFITDTGVDLIAKILGINIHIYNSYVQGFVWKYYDYITNIKNAPHVMINNTDNIHYEPFIIKNGEDLYGLMSDDFRFVDLLKNFSSYVSIIKDRELNAQEWYDNIQRNKQVDKILKLNLLNI